jgi:hypothetical protein
MLIVVVAVATGCSTVPKTAAIQKTAVGGGLIATGAVTTTFAVVGGGLGLASVPLAGLTGDAAGGATTTVLISAGFATAIGVTELAIGGVLLSQGGEALDELEGFGRKLKDSRASRVRESPRPRAKPVRKPIETPMWGPMPPDPPPEVEPEESDEGPPRRWPVP